MQWARGAGEGPGGWEGWGLFKLGGADKVLTDSISIPGTQIRVGRVNNKPLANRPTVKALIQAMAYILTFGIIQPGLRPILGVLNGENMKCIAVKSMVRYLMYNHQNK